MGQLKLKPLKGILKKKDEIIPTAEPVRIRERTFKINSVPRVLLLSALLLVLKPNVTAAGHSRYTDYPMGYFRYPNQNGPQEQEITPDLRYTIRPSRPAVEQEEFQPVAKFLYRYFTTVVVEQVVWFTLTTTTGVTTTATITPTVTSTTTTTSTSTVTTTTGPKWADYTYVNGLGYYRVYPALVTFDEAKARCEADGARMIIFNSQSETEAMASLIISAEVFIAWVGLTDSVTEGTILTILGDPLSSTFEMWVSGEPNNTPQSDCVYMDLFGPGMYISNCVDNHFATVCEI